MKKYIEEVTLLQAIAECYNFKPRSHKKRIEFEIVFPGSEKTLRFGKSWNKIEKEWRYYEGATYEPTFGQVEKHFLSNLFCHKLGEKQSPLVYSAQQGEFKVYRVDTENA